LKQHQNINVELQKLVKEKEKTNGQKAYLKEIIAENFSDWRKI
jgi:hypothetical protein